MKSFEKIFYNHLEEDNAAGAGGVFGNADSMGHGGAFDTADFYATGDARIPKGGKKKKKEKDKKKKDGSLEPLIPLQRRPLTST